MPKLSVPALPIVSGFHNGPFSCSVTLISDVTSILDAIHRGDPKAADELLPLVYEELRRLAARKMARTDPGQTLQPTALVHEAWLKLAGSKQQRWNDRSHFFRAAAEAMRQILIDQARRKSSQKRGSNQAVEELHESKIELRAPSAARRLHPQTLFFPSLLLPN